MSKDPSLCWCRGCRKQALVFRLFCAFHADEEKGGRWITRYELLTAGRATTGNAEQELFKKAVAARVYVVWGLLEDTITISEAIDIVERYPMGCFKGQWEGDKWLWRLSSSSPPTVSKPSRTTRGRSSRGSKR